MTYPSGVLKISPNFTFTEATVTSTKLSNKPNDMELAVLGRTAMKLEEVRSLLGNKPIIVNFWFRSEEVNNAVGGVWNSQHRLGEAVDFICPTYGTPEDITNLLKAHADELNYDQLILEPSWVHISWITNREDPRKIPRKQFINACIRSQ